MQRTMACLFFSSHVAQARVHNTHTHKHTQSEARQSAVLNQVCGAEQAKRGRGEELSKHEESKKKKKLGAYSAKKQEISIETIRDTAKAGRGGQAQDRGLFWARRPS